MAARLYVLTPDAPGERILELVAAALRGGADAIQLRHKTARRGELLEIARSLRRLTADALLVVNDHVDIALLSGADGVHLGADDMSIESARRVGGERLLIGASASSPAAARAAVALGADYVGCGPAFSTPNKAGKEVIGPIGVAAVVAAVGADVPVFAIGGIDESNVEALIQQGVRRVCVIRAVSDATSPEQAARRLRAMLAG
ncbi:MAG: thiamine phosphate synthase [Candidatus Dormibacterales bacterium]